MSKKHNSGSVILTHHAKKRANQRAGITKNQLNTMSKRALSDGLSQNETINGLKKWMDSEFLKYKTANNCKLYANQLYIFHNQTLITILNAPLVYEQNLYSYVKDIKTYLKYKKNRIKHKKHVDSYLDNIFTKEITTIISNRINEYLLSLEYYRHYPYELYLIDKRNFQIIIAYYNKSINKHLSECITEYIKNEFGLDVTFKKLRKISLEIKYDDLSETEPNVQLVSTIYESTTKQIYAAKFMIDKLEDKFIITSDKPLIDDTCTQKRLVSTFEMDKDISNKKIVFLAKPPNVYANMAIRFNYN